MESRLSFGKILTYYLSSFMENVSDLLPHLEFFRKHKKALKQVRVTLCKIDVLHHCNRLLVRLSSICDELKELH